MDPAQIKEFIAQAKVPADCFTEGDLERMMVFFDCDEDGLVSVTSLCPKLDVLPMERPLATGSAVHFQLILISCSPNQ